MREAGRFMDGLSVHYYTFMQDWDHKGAATGFPQAEWYSTLKSALGIEDFINRTASIMDRYDPAKRVGMIIDEWGTWHKVEPGTNPGFLYQQNTIRDAVVAGLSFDIFNRHADRVHMANIAQTVNVLQAMILTEGPKMVLTPTYHVFDMYKVHQDATHLPLYLQSERIEEAGLSIPKLSASASRDSGGKLHLSLCNLSATDKASVEVELRGTAGPKSAEGRLLAAPKTDSHNDFAHPSEVAPRPYEARIEGGRVLAELPPMSVAVVELEP